MFVIHIGLAKAGSSSLQDFLSDNEGSLRALSIDFVRTGRLEGRAHHNLASEIQSRRRFNAARGTVSELADYSRSAPSRVFVLSSEMFEGAETDEISGMRDTLLRARGKEEFRIVLVIRDLVDLMPSSYAQKIKFGIKTFDFDSFFDERMQARRVNYFETATRWADVFGWDNLRVRVLDRQHLLNGDLVDDFLMICGIELGEGTVPLLKRTKVSNAAPGWKVLEAVRALFTGRHNLSDDDPLIAAVRRKDGRALGRRAFGVGERYGWNSDKGRYLTRAQAQICIDVYKASIKEFNECLPEKLPLPPELALRGFNEREFLPDATFIPRDELQLFYEDLRLRMAPRIQARAFGTTCTHAA